MSNISGIAPYIELSKTAKSYGGPKSYICKLRSSEYVSGYSAGYSSGNTAGLITGCIVTGLATSAILCLLSYKKHKAKSRGTEGCLPAEV